MSTQPVPTIVQQEDGLDDSVETRKRPKRRVHMTLQSKGGIGKSHVARILCEYFSEAEAFDLDDQNQTLSGIEALQASLVETGGAGSATIKVEALDELWSRLVESDANNIVIDSAAHIYMPLLYFMEDSDATEILRSCGFETWFHLIACGGTEQKETLKDIDRLIDRWGARVHFLLWDNDYHGPIIAGDDRSERGLVNTVVYKTRWANRVDGVVQLERPQSLYQRDVEQVLAAGATFREIAENDVTPITRRSRLLRVWKAIASQLDVYYNKDAVKGEPITAAAMQQLGDARQRAESETHPDDPTVASPPPTLDVETHPDASENDGESNLEGVDVNDEPNDTPNEGGVKYDSPTDPHELEYQSGVDDEDNPDADDENAFTEFGERY